MSGQIRMTPEELKSKAVRYKNSSEQINHILKDLQSLQNELRGEWEGKAFNRFDDQFEQLRPKVVNFADLMQQIHDQLVATANAVARQDEELSQNFGLN